MCKWGTYTILRVPIPASCSHTGKFRWKDDMPVDRCIAPIVDALNKAGIFTGGSCCGHGKQDGFIALHDGTLISIRRNHFTAEDASCVSKEEPQPEGEQTDEP